MLAPTECSEIIEQAGRARSVEDIHALCTRVCRRLGFDYFIYGAQFPVSLIKPHIIIVSGYPRDWREHYDSNGYMGVDPTVAHCREHVVPLNWQDLQPDADTPAPLIRFMSDAQDFGIRSGASFPVHGGHGESAILSFACERGAERTGADIQQAMPFAHLLSAHIHEAVRRVFGDKYIPMGSNALSEREKECLVWSAEGKTTWEIAQILKIADRTVIFHLHNATEKLGVSNRQQAVARAIAQSLIMPSLD